MGCMGSIALFRCYIGIHGQIRRYKHLDIEQLNDSIVQLTADTRLEQNIATPPARRLKSDNNDNHHDDNDGDEIDNDKQPTMQPPSVTQGRRVNGP